MTSNHIAQDKLKPSKETRIQPLLEHEDCSSGVLTDGRGPPGRNTLTERLPARQTKPTSTAEQGLGKAGAVGCPAARVSQGWKCHWMQAVKGLREAEHSLGSS